jgi:FO synthase
MTLQAILSRAIEGNLPGADDALALCDHDLAPLLQAAASLRDIGFGNLVTYSPKVFIPLTQLCRDVCHYCTFASPPRPDRPAYLQPDSVLGIARAGAAAGCREALFTLGDKPELRWSQAREGLQALGHETTIQYVVAMAKRVVDETGLLPHINPGVMSAAELAQLRPVAASMGIMLETLSQRLAEKGGPHFGSPDKAPAARLACIEQAGLAKIPFTSGILIGIGETRAERIGALLALRSLHEKYGHIQEIIIQNFVPKPGTRMAGHSAPSFEDHLWTIAIARLLFGSAMSIQAPPNLAAGALPHMVRAGLNDWGGVSPVTPDHVNPEAPWPEIAALSSATEKAGKTLVKRLTIYPHYALRTQIWADPAMRKPILRASDSCGFAREDAWQTGSAIAAPRLHVSAAATVSPELSRIITRAEAGRLLDEHDIVRLFAARGAEAEAVFRRADRLRAETVGDSVSYVVTRNINYTNVCAYACRFCAFSKGRTHADLRGAPYDLNRAEFSRRVEEAWARGATEICLQGGIHPDYDGDTYLQILRAAREAAPGIHIHAFSPLEIAHGARTLGLSLEAYLVQLKQAGLSSLPGTAAEILDDEVRADLCKDKLSTAEWFAVMQAAHGVGLRSTSTIMFGHIEQPQHWARHLLRLRAHQAGFGGFTEFVPLPFVAREAPIYRQGEARMGPTWREALLMHAVARLVLHPVITNIQTSWVKMGPLGAEAALQAGANDLGGTLMDESITRAAGAVHGQELGPCRMEEIIRGIGRTPRQRTTLYRQPDAERVRASFAAPGLAEKINTPLRRKSEASRLDWTSHHHLRTMP